jgi:glucose/mannose transport system permease protein
MWYTTFRATRYGRGAAIATIIFLTVAVLIVPYLVNTMRTEVEQ